MSTPRSNQLKKVLHAPRILLSRIIMYSVINKCLSDKTYLKWMYYLRTGKRLNLDNPTTFNEKLQWLKLHNNRNLEYAQWVDKIDVRSLVTEKIGERYLIPILGVWNNFDDIDFSKLPEQFVLKCSHDSGSVLVCHNKAQLDLKKIRHKFNKALKNNYFWVGREYPYKNVQPRIVCEQLMVDKNSPDLVDYKFFCFDGEPKILFYASERFTSPDGVTRFDFYDMDLKHLDIKREGHKNATNPLHLSVDVFNEMKQLCRILSQGFLFVRVDLYLINNKIYFGELTFHPGGGFVNFQPEIWNKRLGDWIQLNS